MAALKHCYESNDHNSKLLVKEVFSENEEEVEQQKDKTIDLNKSVNLQT